MDTFSRRYDQLVGLNSDWVIASVDRDVKNRRLTLALDFVGLASCARSLKEFFRYFSRETDAVAGRTSFDSWHGSAIRSRLDPIKKVARMLKNRFDRILTRLSSPISKGPAEGFNSRIQAIKYAV